MKPWSAWERVLLILNTLGFLGWMIWLVVGGTQFLYTQDGIVQLLPCLPFFFVYGFLVHHRHEEDEEKRDEGDG